MADNRNRAAYKKQYRLEKNKYWAMHDPYENLSQKICPGCNYELERHKFSKNSNEADGLRAYCKVCEAKQKISYRVNNKALALLQNANQRAKKKNLLCNITINDIIIPEICPVLCIPLVLGTGRFHDNSPTLDRINPGLGYIPGNVRVISWRANMLKNNATIEELKKILDDAERLSKIL